MPKGFLTDAHESLESWRKDHEAFFRAEGEALGYRFSENMDVVFEEFEAAEILNSRSDINGRGNEYPYSVRYPDASVHRVQSRAGRIPDHFIPKNAANCLMT